MGLDFVFFVLFSYFVWWVLLLCCFGIVLGAAACLVCFVGLAVVYVQSVNSVVYFVVCFGWFGFVLIEYVVIC